MLGDTFSLHLKASREAEKVSYTITSLLDEPVRTPFAAAFGEDFALTVTGTAEKSHSTWTLNPIHIASRSNIVQSAFDIELER